MLESMLVLDNIAIYNKAENWVDAITKAVTPLFEHGYVEARYIQSIIDNTRLYGPYYVLAPELALPHARPEQGVLKKQIGVTLLRHPVKFSEDGYDVRLLITLAASDSQSHLEALQTLSEIMMDESRMAHILNAKTREEILWLFTQSNKKGGID
jgi:PTS system ascorbate-specific IIA component